MRALFELIEKRLPAGPAPSLRRVLGTVFIGESDLEARISKVRSAHPAVRFGFRSTGLVQQVRLYASDASALDDAAAAVLAELEGHAFGQGDDTLASALGARLTARGATVATAESCTGGMVGAALTEVPGSSTYYVGGVVAYANAVKVEALGVEPALLDVHGAVSEPVAIAMAAGARDRFGSDFAVSTTGVAGPGGGTDDKPVGLVWIGGAGPDGPWSKRLQVTGDRDTVRRRTVQHALAELWRRSV
jgi:nicotinamide-nucleotide amidase